MTTLALSPSLALPLDAVTQRHAFLGKPGSGKSYAASKLAELMLDAGAQVIALDPVGIWYGLRLDGKGKGIAIPVFGGLHGDVPLEPTSGAMLADLIVDRRLSCVLDVSQFEHDTDKARFAAAFANRFFFRMKASPSAVHLFYEECQEFMPQNPQKGEEHMLHNFTRMDKLGRNFGIGRSLITQRPQEVNKKVLNLTECLFAFQMTGAHERKAIKEWVTTIGGDENILTLLPALAVAHAHVYSPQWLRVNKTVLIGEKRTADVSSTPAVGALTAGPSKPLAPVELDKIRVAMAETIEKAKADDPKELRKEISRLMKLVETGKAPAPSVDERAMARAVELARREERARFDGLSVAFGRLVKYVRDTAVSLNNTTGALFTTADSYTEALADVLTTGESRADVQVGNKQRGTGANQPPVQTVGQQSRSTTRPTVTPVSHEGITGVEQKILNTLCALEDLGISPVDKATAAALVGYHPNAKSYANALGSLRTAGRIEYPSGGQVALTDDGRALSASHLSIASLDDLHRIWFDRLGNIATKILEPLIEAYPNAVDAAVVAEIAGYHQNAKSFANMRGRLRTLGLIDYPKPGKLAATKVLFPEGLR